MAMMGRGEGLGMEVRVGEGGRDKEEWVEEWGKDGKRNGEEGMGKKWNGEW